MVATSTEVLPPVQRLLNDLHTQYAEVREGEVATYIPERLDARGNSVRGVLVCDSLSRTYSLNMTVRASYDATEVSSKRQRSTEEAKALASQGGRIRVYELQGQLNFASVERFSRDVVARTAATDYFVIDFKLAARIDTGAIELFCDLMGSLLDAGKLLSLSDAEHLPGLAERVDAIAMTRAGVELAENRDRAIEWCEDELLESLGAAKRAEEVPLAGNDFCRGLDAAAAENLAAVAVRGRAKAGERLVEAGGPSGSVFLLVRGEVSVTIAAGRHRSAGQGRPAVPGCGLPQRRTGPGHAPPLG